MELIKPQKKLSKVKEISFEKREYSICSAKLLLTYLFHGWDYLQLGL